VLTKCRLSRTNAYLDWSGGLPTIQGAYESFVTRRRYSARGVAYELIAPYQPGKDLPRTYRASLQRDALVGMQDLEAAQYFFGNASGTAGILYDAAAMPIQITLANGHTLRLIDSGGVTSGALWDDRGRMRVLVGGDPYTAAGIPSENYLFDASGNRFARQDKRGFPTITLRDLSGQALAEYTKKSGDTFPKLDRDLIYGAGKLLVERVVTGVLPHATGSDPLRTSTNYNFNLDAGTTSSRYDVDIQTSAGFQNYLTGMQLGSGNSFTIPESALPSQQVNFVRIRGANPQITPYSQPVSVIYDPNITSSSTNNVHALTISRSGTSVLVRWELAGTTTKKFRVYFKNADGSATYLLIPLGLTSGTRTDTLTDQTLSQVCGDFYVTIVLTEVPLTESPPSPFGRLGSSQAGIQGPLDPCGGGTGSNPISYAFANSYHHRDHLGSLRAETDEAGNRTVKRDYYAFGIEQQGYAASSEAATARQFTGAEKGFFNGLDSMMARFNSGNAGRFLSPDPILGNAMNPRSWNRYSFVLNSPLSYTDPSGKLPIPVFNNGPNRGSADDGGGSGEHRSMEAWRGRITFHNVDAYFAMRAWEKAEAARRRTANFCQRNPRLCGLRSVPPRTPPPAPTPTTEQLSTENEGGVDHTAVTCGTMNTTCGDPTGAGAERRKKALDQITDWALAAAESPVTIEGTTYTSAVQASTKLGVEVGVAVNFGLEVLVSTGTANEVTIKLRP
jgi:RHS repeat-associated protein